MISTRRPAGAGGLANPGEVTFNEATCQSEFIEPCTNWQIQQDAEDKRNYLDNFDKGTQPQCILHQHKAKHVNWRCHNLLISPREKPICIPGDFKQEIDAFKQTIEIAAALHR